MNFLFKKTNWSVFEIALVKIASGSACIFIGTYFATRLRNDIPLIIGILCVTSLWVTYLWLSKINK